MRVTVAAVIFFKKSATEWMTTQIQIDLGFPPQRPLGMTGFQGTRDGFDLGVVSRLRRAKGRL